MITTKQWSDFQKYRNEMYLEVLTSHKYKRLNKFFENIMKTEKKKVVKRFLWITWEEEIELKLDYITSMIAYEFYQREKNILFSVVPEPTIENCLNWLISKRSIGHKNKTKGAKKALN